MYRAPSPDTILNNYDSARETYLMFGVDTDKVLKDLTEIPVSLHCWQGDDVTGFEGQEELSGGGIIATGNYPGRARNGEELRSDIDFAFDLIPGKHRVNLHALYAETGGVKTERDELSLEHFSKWLNWAKEKKITLDFNPSFFSHPMADSGFTLASPNKKIRDFWIRHAKACRDIAAGFGRELGKPCVNNLWIPDGSKDLPADRMNPRRTLKESLDEIYEKKLDEKYLLDSVECKLFGIGSEAYVVGSHEFYLAYALSRNIMLCLDTGHFHPTESIADKISSVLVFMNKLLLHVSRGVRWDSDHVVLLDDEVRSIAQEVKRAGGFDKVHFALDFFDASINRVTAWVIGTRALLKAIMLALLEPTDMLKSEEEKGNFGNRLALMEELKSLPFGSVWYKFCYDNRVPAGSDWLNKIEEYENTVMYMRK